MQVEEGSDRSTATARKKQTVSPDGVQVLGPVQVRSRYPLVFNYFSYAYFLLLF